ncbi:hypothetical protein ACI2JA_19965 [Alkalihalobacillus sp. NPDC078783]
MYTTEEAYEQLKALKITSNIESVRRWLRTGTIKAKAPSTKKEGWRIPRESLEVFIRTRLPDMANEPTKEQQTEIEENAREKMWWEIVQKNVFDDRIEIKKSRVKECIAHHRRDSAPLLEKIWNIVKDHNMGYRYPCVLVLLDAFLFKGERVMLDQNFEDKEEQVLFALIEHCRQEIVNSK